jgi:hypothetical protein
VLILKPNNPPSQPVVEGPLRGHKDTSYEFTALSIDIDNDSIQYLFDWGDGEATKTAFLPSGVAAIQTHTWTKYGEYTIRVRVFDRETESIVTNFTILIDVLPIDDKIKGYLVDNDSEGTYDIFDNIVTGDKIDVKVENNKSYLIDIDGDGKKDYVYDLDEGLLTYFDYVYKKYLRIYEKTPKAPAFEMVTLLMVVLFIILRRRRYK